MLKARVIQLSGRLATAAIVASPLLLLNAPLAAAEAPTFAITLENDVFAPAELKVPANQAFVLKIFNKEKAAVEFESKDFKIEKVAPAGGEILARVKAMPPGRYLLVNEYKEESVKTMVVVE